MSYSTGTSHPFLSTASNGQEWDPETVLELRNPLKGSVTCVGHAPSRGRRCQNRIAARNITCALSIVNKLANENASKAAASPQLETVASFLLCKQFHQNQAAVVAQKWRVQLEDWAARHEDVKLSSSDSGWGGSGSDDSDHSYDDDHDDTRLDVKYEKDTKSEDGRASINKLVKMMKQMQDDFARLEAELRKQTVNIKNEVKVELKMEEEEKVSISTIEDERKKRDEEEQRKRKAEEEEEKKKRCQEEERRCQEEEERKLREEEARKQEEERRHREEEAAAAAAARTRAFQERVRHTRERLERERKEKTDKEAADWRAAWERYSKQWDSGQLSVTNIPWPVKSGLWWEVNEANVKLFFAKAPPEELRATARERVVAMNDELRRWHADKVIHHLGAEFANSFVKGTLDTVGRVLVGLRQEAQRERT